VGPNNVILNLELAFRSGLSAGGVEAAVDRVERAVRGELPHVKHIFVEAKSLSRARGDGVAPGERASPEQDASGA
jgi:divalent metal cation (Fe/Co/Zn/Cd) transporter